MTQFSGIAVASLWLICTTLALIASAYQLFSTATVYRFARSKTAKKSVPASSPSVTILKPLYGAEPDLYENLRSFVVQDYAAAVEVVFGVQRPDDPAIQVVEQLIAAYPGQRLKLVINSAVHGSNLKISNLINMSVEARHDVIVLADSDIHVAPDYLAQVINALEAPGVGLVSCLYSGRPAGGLWSRLSGLAIDHHFFPSVLVGLRLGLAQPCFGSTIALRADTLQRVGGFRAFTNQLADDYALGAAVRKLGLATSIPNIIVGHSCSETTFKDLVSHELRWARTIKLVDPAGHLGSITTHALPHALIAAVLQSSHIAAVGLITLALASRALLQIQVDRAIGTSEGRLRWGPIRDLLSFAVFLASLMPGTVLWRGHRYGVTSDGTMTPTPDELPGENPGE